MSTKAKFHNYNDTIQRVEYRSTKKIERLMTYQMQVEREREREGQQSQVKQYRTDIMSLSYYISVSQ